MTDVAAAPVEPTSEAVTLTPVTTAPMADAVVTVCKSPVGAHVGISYRVDDAGARRHLHLAFHFRLKDDEAPDVDALWVAPRLDEIALADVRASAHLIARRHKDGRVPYAFHKGAAHFSATTGALELKGSLGLTCATFVDLVFARANVPLLDAATWEDGRSPERRAEDEAAQRLPRGVPATDPRRGEARGAGGEGSPLHEDPRGRGRGCLGDDRAPHPVCARRTGGRANPRSGPGAAEAPCPGGRLSGVSSSSWAETLTPGTVTERPHGPTERPPVGPRVCSRLRRRTIRSYAPVKGAGRQNERTARRPSTSGRTSLIRSVIIRGSVPSAAANVVISSNIVVAILAHLVSHRITGPIIIIPAKPPANTKLLPPTQSRLALTDTPNGPAT